MHLDHLAVGDTVVGVDLQQLDVVRAQPGEAAVDGVAGRLRGPRRPCVVQARVSHLGCDHELVPAVGDSATDQLLAVAVALGRVQEVDPGVQRRAQYAIGLRDLV